MLADFYNEKHELTLTLAGDDAGRRLASLLAARLEKRTPAPRFRRSIDYRTGLRTLYVYDGATLWIFYNFDN